MGKYIACGQYNNNFKYIILSCVFNILVNFIFGFDLDYDFKGLLLIPSKGQKILYMHSRVYEIFKNIGVFVFACTFYKIETMQNKKKVSSQRTLSFSSAKSNNEITYIFNDIEDEIGSISILNFIFVITVYVCIEQLSDIFFQLGLMIFDFWMFELLIISYINAKMFKLKIYRHQMFAILFNSIICLLFRLPSFILSLSMETDDENNENGESLFEISKWYIVLGMVIYIMIITIRAYSYTKIKWFIDLKYISSTKLLIFIGFIGIIVSSISCIIVTFIKCSPDINFCEIIITDNSTNSTNSINSTIKYLDNLYVFFNKISTLDYYEIIIEACVILFGMIFKFFFLYYNILIIEYLTPVHIIFYASIFYFIIKIIAIIYDKIISNNYFNGNKEFNNKKFFLDTLGNFIAIFGFLIYLELIELRCCKLNYNLRKTISNRSIDDIKQSIEYEGFNEEDEQSEKENSKISELESNPL